MMELLEEETRLFHLGFCQTRESVKPIEGESVLKTLQVVSRERRTRQTAR